MNITKPSKLNTAHGFCPVTREPSMRSSGVELQGPANYLCNASTAGDHHGALAPVDTVVARDVRTIKSRFGWIGARASYCRWSILCRPYTLPHGNGSLARENRIIVCNLMFACVSGAMNDFGLKPPSLGAGYDRGSLLSHNKIYNFPLRPPF